MKLTPRSGAVLAAAAASLIVGGTLVSTDVSAKSHKVACMGVNACKGQGACKGADNACKGKNACKGHGVSMLTKTACAKAGGTVN